MEIPSIAKSEEKHINTSFALLTNEIRDFFHSYCSVPTLCLEINGEQRNFSPMGKRNLLAHITIQSKW